MNGNSNVLLAVEGVLILPLIGMKRDSCIETVARYISTDLVLCGSGSLVCHNSHVQFDIIG